MVSAYTGDVVRPRSHVQETESRRAFEAVVPAEWVAASLSRHVEFERSRGGAIGYGYWWWVLPPDPDGKGKQDIYGAFGFKGQYIFLVPEHDTVVVVTAGGSGWEEESAPRKFLYSHILKAMH